MKILSLSLLLVIFSLTANAQKDTVQNISSVIGKTPVDSSILIVINGSVLGTLRELKINIFKTIPADIIERLDILKDFKATDKYGERGKAGVLEFYLKDNVKFEDVKVMEADAPVLDPVFNKVDIYSAFPGGDQAWKNFLVKNLNATIPADNYAPSGTYTVLVQFIVAETGEISDVRPLTKHGFGMEEEVTRVINKGPKWIPAILNGKQVKAYRKQPVTFMVLNDIELSTYTIPAGKPTSVELRINSSGIKFDDLELTLSTGTIIHENGNKYVITVDKPGQVLLSIKQTAKKKKDEASFGPVAIQVK